MHKIQTDQCQNVLLIGARMSAAQSQNVCCSSYTLRETGDSPRPDVVCIDDKSRLSKVMKFNGQVYVGLYIGN